MIGDLAYIVDTAKGFQIIDVSNPSSPVRLGGYAAQANGFALADNKAYLAAGSSGLQLVDVSNPRNPVFLGGIQPASVYLPLRCIVESASMPPELLIRSATNDALEVQLRGTQGNSYRIEVSTDLRQWTALPEHLVSFGSITITAPQRVTNSHAYYRAIRSNLPPGN